MNKGMLAGVVIISFLLGWFAHEKMTQYYYEEEPEEAVDFQGTLQPRSVLPPQYQNKEYPDLPSGAINDLRR